MMLSFASDDNSVLRPEYVGLFAHAEFVLLSRNIREFANKRPGFVIDIQLTVFEYK